MNRERQLKEKTAKGLMWGGLSNVLQQLLNLVFGVCLSRLLDVEDFGLIGILTIFSLIATTLQESGFTQALTNKDNATHEDFNSVFWCSSAIGIGLYLLLFFCAPYIASFYGNPILTPLSRYLFLGFVFASLGTAYNAYLFKYMMVKERAISMITGLICSGIIGVTMAYLGYAFWGLATQHISYIVCTNLLFRYFSKWRPNLQVTFRPVKEMFSFSYKMVISKICVHLNNHILNNILGKLFTSKEVGYFTQANKWNIMGSSVVTEMIHGVAQPLFKNVSYDNDVKSQVFGKMLRFTSFIVFPSLWGLSFIAPEFIEILLTKKWLDSAYLLQILCIGGAFLPLNNLFSNLIVSSGKSNIYMWCNISLVLAQLLMALLIHPMGIVAMIIGFVALQIAWLFVWYYFVRREINLPVLSLLKEILPYAAISLISIGVVFMLIQFFPENIYLIILCKILFVGIIYFGILYLGKFSILKETIQHIRYIISKR